ncbi:MAG TPA: hypothetical protein VJ654_02800 [Noviherbaspirillum sp.]|nr:hypothetical protein [Noviherbaspirillum sp.]
MKLKRLQPILMDSRRTYRSSVISPLSPTWSGKAAFSLKNLLVFEKQYSHAGVVAGVFLTTTIAAHPERAAKTSITSDARQ